MSQDKKMTLNAFAELCGIPFGTFQGRRSKGVSLRDCIAVVPKSDAIRAALANRGPGAIAQWQTDAVLELLAKGPCGYDELAEVLQLGRGGINHRMRVMRADGLAHIGAWKRITGKGGRFTPVFHAGHGKDVECTLHRMSNAAYSKRWRKTHRHDEMMDRKRAKDRLRHWERKAANVGDPLVMALFGRKAA